MLQRAASISLLFILHIIALYLFYNGFLLTRISFDVVAQRTSHQNNHTFSKAVILVIDALRYDFTIPQNDTKPYWNNLPILARYADDFPENAVLSKFVADPPTTTLQRLKGLTTGSLPTFIDASSNFAGDAITEDNLIGQMKLAKKRIAFAGDDTWQALFPDAFESALNHPFESLNVWDLDTVDNGVYHHLFEASDAFFSNHTRLQWDVVIAHALGLDHAGHRYGPNHGETTRKLRQMNNWLEKLISEIDQETLLIVMGDHGMNSEGDHGGDSEDELNAALFMYSKKPVFTPFRYGDYGRAGVAQIDFVPTLALLLGLPIPYNNLGSPIPQAFSRRSAMRLETAMALCTEQIRKYIRAYEVESANIKQLLSTVNSRYDLQDQDTYKWQRDILKVFRQQWAQYHLPLITYGIIFMMTSIALGVSLYLLRYASLVADTLAFALIFQTTYFFQTLQGSISDQMRWTGTGSGLIIGLLYWSIRPSTDKENRFEREQSGTADLNSLDMLAISTLLLHLAIFASNSFTIFEDRISLLLVGLLIIPVLIKVVASCPSGTGPWHLIWNCAPSISIVFLSRIAASIRLCREEQGQSCASNFHATTLQVIIPFMFLASLVVSQTVQNLYRPDTGSSNVARRWAHVSIDAMLLLSACFWVLDSLDASTLKMLVARAFLSIVCIMLVVWYKIPLPITFRLEKGQLVVVGGEGLLGKSYLQLILPLLSLFAFLSRGLGSITLLSLIATLLWTQSPALARVIKKSQIYCLVLSFELSFLHFFASGHQMTLPSIQWDMAFLASRSIIYPLSPMLVIGNAFASFFVVALCVPAFSSWSPSTTIYLDELDTVDKSIQDKDRRYQSSPTKAMIGLMTLHALITLSTMIFATHFRRHLMVWKIFAPRFMCAALILLVTDLTLLIASLGLGLSELKIRRLAKTLEDLVVQANVKK